MTLMRLKTYREVPPEFYRYCSPETGNWIRKWNVGDWVGEAKRDLERNGFPVPIDLQAQMEDQLCKTLPPGWCEYDDPARPRVNTNLTWADVETASKTFLDWAGEGRPLVEQGEAERRASICARCYLNVRAGGCGQSCRAIIRALAGLFVNRKTSVDAQLNNCAACKCWMSVKVHFPLTTIEAYDTPNLQVLLPSHCWLKKDGPNYQP
jgi:hypothetical protein